MVDSLGEQFFAGAACTRNKYRVLIGGRPERFFFQRLDRFACSNDAIQRITGRSQVDEFFFVQLNFRLQQGKLRGKLSDIIDIFKHHLSEYRNHPAFLLDRNAPNDHALALDLVGLVYFGNVDYLLHYSLTPSVNSCRVYSHHFSLIDKILWYMLSG